MIKFSKTVKKIAVNAFSNQGRQVVDTVVNLLIITLLINKLGIASYGLVVLGQSLIAFMNIFKGGLFGSVSQKLAKSFVQIDRIYSYRIYTAGMFCSLLVSVLLIIVAILVAHMAPMYFNVPSGMERPFQTMLMLIFTAIAFSIATSPVEAVLIAKEDFILWNSVLIIARICYFAMFILCLYFTDLGIVGFGVSLLVWAVIVFAGSFMAVRVKHSHQIKADIKILCIQDLKQIFKFGFFVLLRDICHYFRAQAKTIIINILFGPEMNAIYGLALTWDRLIRMPAANFVNVLIPQVAKLSAAKDTRRTRLLLLKACHYTGIFAIISYTIAVVYRQPIFKLWLGEITSDVNYAMQIMPIIIAGTAVIMANSPAIATLQGAGKVKGMAFASVFALVADGILTWYLIVIENNR